MKFSIKDFFSKCDQIRRKLWIWSHSLKKSLMENFIFLCSDNTSKLRDRLQVLLAIPVGIYLLKVNNRNTRTRYEIYARYEHVNAGCVVILNSDSHLPNKFVLWKPFRNDEKYFLFHLKSSFRS